MGVWSELDKGRLETARMLWRVADTTVWQIILVSNICDTLRTSPGFEWMLELGMSSIDGFDKHKLALKAQLS